MSRPPKLTLVSESVYRLDRPPDSTAEAPSWHEARARGELYRMVAQSADKVGQMRRLTTGQRG